MSFNCPCPNTDPLTTIEASDCVFRLDQIARFAAAKAGQIIFDTVTPASSVPVVAGDPTLEAGWTALRAAVDDTKVVLTPVIGANPVVTAGEASTIGGGDNSTFNGIVQVTQKQPSTFAAQFTDITPDQETQLQALGCNNIAVFIITRDGRIWGQQLAADKLSPIPVYAWFVGDRGSEGFGTRNTNAVSFSLAPDWSNTLAYVTPSDFNAITF